jgi:hypothetical protein
VKSALPWVAALLALVLLVTPTYGIGLVLAPLTLIGTWVALASPVRAPGGVRVGAACNLLLLIAGLSLLTLAWWPEGWPLFAIAWALLVAIVVLLYTAVFRRGEAGRRRSRWLVGRVTGPEIGPGFWNAP